MDTVELARLQFATTTGIHWLFVILTLGVVPLVAIMNTRAALARDPGRRAVLERMTRFWGQVYVINYALGIVTGLVMEFQFGLSWSGLSEFSGNVFGAPLALETMIAFFAESTFLGMWIFGWGKLRCGTQAVLIWLVAVTAYASAFWILVANGFMQSPVGYEKRGGIAYLTDFGAQLTNPNATVALGHIALAALLTGGLFVAGVSAYHLIRRTAEHDFFRRSLRTGVAAAALAVFPLYMLGDMQFGVVDDTQPMKLAVLNGEGVANLQRAMAERYGPGDYIPPEWISTAMYWMLNLGYLMTILAMFAAVVVFRRVLRRYLIVAAAVAGLLGFGLSIYVGALLYGEPGPNEVLIITICVVAVAALLLFGDRVAKRRWAAWPLVAAVPLPFLASVGGWLFREVGRQPWIVYGELTTSEAISSVTFGHMLSSFVVFVVVLAALAVTNWTLIARLAHRGPSATQLGTEPEPETTSHSLSAAARSSR